MRRPWRVLLIAVLLVGGYLSFRNATSRPISTDAPDAAPASARDSAPAGGGAARIAELFAAHESGVVVEAAGTVDRLLADDNDGSRHQRFILRLPTGATVLVSHNIDLAPRVEDLAVGDPVSFRGQYEWNERGGVVHWTHHDPGGRRPGGWIERAGRKFR